MWTEIQLLPFGPRHHYYAVALPRQHTPKPSDPVPLTMLGVWHAEVMRSITTNLPRVFLAALQLFVKVRRDTPRSPTVARTFEIGSAHVLEQMSAVDRTTVSAEFLLEVLDHEPATWGAGMRQEGDGWIRSVPRAVLQFAAISTMRQYIDRLADYLTVPTPVVEPAAPSPLGLASAVDYLNIVWRVSQPKAAPLFALHSAQATTQLAFPANTGEEFESRLSGLGDLLRNYTLPDCASAKRSKVRDKPLAALEAHLVELLPQSAPRIEGAVRTLHNVIDVRDAGQHARARGKSLNALAELGVGYPPPSWQEAWGTISSKAIEALEAIREELATLT